MVIETSALLAILFGEAGSDELVSAIASDERRLVSAPTLVEAAAVLMARKGKQGEIALDALLQRLGIEVVAFSAEAAAFARSAYARYGRGVGTPGVLNYGDCLSYGAALAAGEPLLCQGDDFRRTDVGLAME